MALWSANSGVAALFDALNVVYGEKEKRSLLRFYATTFLLTLGMIGFVILAISAVVVAPVVLTFMGFVTPAERLLAILRWPILLVVVGVWLAVIYRYGPSRRDPKWRWVTWGSVTAAVLWLAASMLFSWYVANFDSYNKTYGSLGAGVGFMVWIWLSVVIVLLGAELNAEMEHQTARTAPKGRRSRWAPAAPTWRIMLVRRTPDTGGNAVARDASQAVGVGLQPYSRGESSRAVESRSRLRIGLRRYPAGSNGRQSLRSRSNAASSSRASRAS